MRDPADLGRVGVGVQSPVVGDGGLGARTRARARRSADRSAARATVPAHRGAGRALEPWQTIRPLPIITMSSAMISISRSRCEDSRTVPPPVRVVAEQVPHPADAGRVEAVGGLVEDQHAGVADQRGGDAEPLAHPERVVADPAVGLGRR